MISRDLDLPAVFAALDELHRLGARVGPSYGPLNIAIDDDTHEVIVDDDGRVTGIEMERM